MGFRIYLKEEKEPVLLTRAVNLFSDKWTFGHNFYIVDVEAFKK